MIIRHSDSGQSIRLVKDGLFNGWEWFRYLKELNFTEAQADTIIQRGCVTTIYLAVADKRCINIIKDKFPEYFI